MTKVLFKFADYILCPSNVVKGEECETADGVKCKCKYIGTWNNEDGRYDDELDDMCIRRFGFPFQSIRSLWIARLDVLSPFWHLIKLERV